MNLNDVKKSHSIKSSELEDKMKDVEARSKEQHDEMKDKFIWKIEKRISASRLRIEEVEAKSIGADANNEKALQEAIADGENPMNENMEKTLNDQCKSFKSIIESQQDNHRAEFSSLQEKYDAELQSLQKSEEVMEKLQECAIKQRINVIRVKIGKK